MNAVVVQIYRIDLCYIDLTLLVLSLGSHDLEHASKAEFFMSLQLWDLDLVDHAVDKPWVEKECFAGL